MKKWISLFLAIVCACVALPYAQIAKAYEYEEHIEMFQEMLEADMCEEHFVLRGEEYEHVSLPPHAFGYECILAQYREAVLEVEAWYTEFDGDEDEAEGIFYFMSEWTPMISVKELYGKEDAPEACFGYAYCDLNGDQRPELILLSDNGQWNGYEIFSIFTIAQDGTLKWFGPYGGENFNCYLQANNTFNVYYWSHDGMSMDVVAYGWSDSGDELITLAAFGTEGEDIWDEQSDEDEEYVRYYQTGEDGERMTITEEEYQNLRALYPPKHYYEMDGADEAARLIFIPLFDK